MRRRWMTLGEVISDATVLTLVAVGTLCLGYHWGYADGWEAKRLQVAVDKYQEGYAAGWNAIHRNIDAEDYQSLQDMLNETRRELYACIDELDVDTEQYHMPVTATLPSVQAPQLGRPICL